MTVLKYGYAIMISVLLALSYTQSQELKAQLTQTQHQLDGSTSFIHKAFPDLKDTDIPKMSYDVKQVDPNSLNCLAQNIYFEGRSQSDLGKIAIARVTLNRTESSRYPNSVCGVVYQKSGRSCQFSWTCNSKSRIISDETSWQASVRIARQILAFDSYQNVVDGATYYHADYVHPNWTNLVKVGRVDDHIFYKEKL